jgi:hypothetical protein
MPAKLGHSLLKNADRRQLRDQYHAATLHAPFSDSQTQRRLHQASRRKQRYESQRGKANDGASRKLNPDPEEKRQ